MDNIKNESIVSNKKINRAHSSHKTEKFYIKKTKHYIKKYFTFGLIFILAGFILFGIGMYTESKTGYVANMGILDFIEGKKYTSVEYYEIPKIKLEKIIREFICIYFVEDDPQYVDTVTAAFMKLFDKVPEDRQNILYYIALCSVESNFKMSARNSVGAAGISQVMYSVWGDTIKKNYGISRESLYISPYENIYAGYMIWKNYWKKNGFNIKKANAGYLGANSEAYNGKISERHSQLVNMIFKEVFKQKTKIKTIELK